MMSYLSRYAFVCASGCDARDCLSLGTCGQCGPITVTCYKLMHAACVGEEASIANGMGLQDVAGPSMNRYNGSGAVGWSILS